MLLNYGLALNHFISKYARTIYFWIQTYQLTRLIYLYLYSTLQNQGFVTTHYWPRESRYFFTWALTITAPCLSECRKNLNQHTWCKRRRDVYMYIYLRMFLFPSHFKWWQFCGAIFIKFWFLRYSYKTLLLVWCIPLF